MPTTSVAVSSDLSSAVVLVARLSLAYGSPGLYQIPARRPEQVRGAGWASELCTMLIGGPAAGGASASGGGLGG